jgi:beta-galactosidase
MNNIGRRQFLGRSITAAVLSGLPLPSWLLAAPPLPAGSALPPLIGVDYYPDQTPEKLWQEDAKWMSETGFTNVRIAEFAWALMEPEEGKFDFDWLHRSVGILDKNHLVVILGTPSAAPPPWLSAKYPEIYEVNAEGQKLHPGGRRFTCPTNKTYRRLSLTIAEKMARAFAETPGVVGWQIDNELTLGSSPLCYCDACQAGFQEWLLKKYGTLAKLNDVWGTVFWSQTYTGFSQIPVPLPSGAPPNPGLALDYERYQSYANTSFMAEQLDMLRKVCPKHFITTNNVGVPADLIDMRELYENLDFVAFDNYPGFLKMHFDERAGGADVGWETIAAMTAMEHDFARSVKGGKPFMIMEEQSGKAGQPSFCPQPEKGQVRLWTHQAVAHGAMGINYFRWDTATFAAEEYWHGVLNHDRSKSPAFDEIQQTLREIKSLGPEILNSSCRADAALLFDYDCSWAVKIQPGQTHLNYVQEISKWYSAINENHFGIDMPGPEQDYAGRRILFAPVLYVLSAKTAAQIRKFVHDGGIFVAGFRLGVKDEFSRIVQTPLPGLLRDVMGTTVEEYVPIYSGGPSVKFNGSFAGDDGKAEIWADILKPSGAEVLATYSSGDYSGEAAVTSNSFGKGKAVYIGADLDAKSLARVLRNLCAGAGCKSPLDAPAGVDMTVRSSGGREWIFLLNHTKDTKSVPVSKPYKDLLTGEQQQGSVKLSKYGVRVLQAV